MLSKGYIERESMLFVIRLLRIFSLAPVTITKECNGYSMSLSRLYAIIGYVGFILLTILQIICVWVDIKVKENENTLLGQFPLVVFLWIADILFCTIITCYGAYSSVTTMRNFIKHMTLLEKINTGYEKTSNKGIVVFMICSRMLLDSLYMINVTYDNSVKGFLIFAYCASRFKYLMVCLIQVYMFSLYDVVHTKVRVYREKLEKLTDLMDYVFDGSSIEFTQIMNMKLQKKYEALVSIREIFTQMNKCNEYMVFLLFLSSVVRIVQASFHVVKYNDNSPAKVALQGSYLLHHLLNLALSVRPFRGINVEMLRIKLLIARISTTNYVKTCIPLPLEHFYNELFTADLSFSPLGVFTMRRSLVAKTLGAVISYLIIIFQFKV